MKNVKTLYIFRQQYRRKMCKLRKKYIYIFFAVYTFFVVSQHVLFSTAPPRYTVVEAPSELGMELGPGGVQIGVTGLDEHENGGN